MYNRHLPEGRVLTLAALLIAIQEGLSEASVVLAALAAEMGIPGDPPRPSPPVRHPLQ